MPSQPLDLAINGRFLDQATTGVQRVAHELTREIDRLVAEGEGRFRIRLICPEAADIERLELKAIAVERAPGPKGWLWEQTSLPRAAGDAHLLCLGNSAPILSLMRGRRVGLMIHDVSYRKFPSAYRLSYRLFHALLLPALLRRADPLITVSRAELASLKEISPSRAARVTVAQNGGWRDLTHATSLPPRPDGGYALYVGSLSERKNFSGLLEVAIRLVRENGVRFVFVGEAGKVLAPVNCDLPSDVEDSIDFLGQVEELGRLEQIYRGAACLVFPSFYEASPLPPIEAMHFGCPVVASRTPAMLERCGPAADYCDPADVDSILSSVRRVLFDQAHAEELRRKGFEWQQKYSWRAQAKIVLQSIWAASAKP